MKIFRAKQQTYLMPERITRTTWHPQVKVNNQWCYLPDKSTLSGLVEATDETTATELAIKELREMVVGE